MTVSYYMVGDLQVNCVVIADENANAVVIDPGDDAAELTATLRSKALNVKAVLLTHAHFDHLLAVKELQKEFNAPLWLHEAEAPALEDAGKSLIPAYRRPYILKADRLLRDGETVAVGELEFEVLHTPGHTVGSCCYRFGDVLVSGDTLFAQSIGRTDLPGGNTAQMFHSLRRLSTLPDTLRVIPGHGPETVLGYERHYNPYLSRS